MKKGGGGERAGGIAFININRDIKTWRAENMISSIKHRYVRNAPKDGLVFFTDTTS